MAVNFYISEVSLLFIFFSLGGVGVVVVIDKKNTLVMSVWA